jgi:hypothetical protein
LLLVFLALGTGTLEYLHNLQHAQEDAREDALLARKGGPLTPHESHEHDDSNCPVHAQLHLPLMSGGWVPLLVLLGLFVAFLSLLSQPLIHRAVPARIDCRGPPVCA